MFMAFIRVCDVGMTKGVAVSGVLSSITSQQQDGPHLSTAGRQVFASHLRT